MSWESLGPDSLQFKCMQEAARRVCREDGHDPELFYIWLDVLSIPQANEDCKVLAIDSLFLYASVADFLVIICPPSCHQQTGECGGEEAYRARTWCRVEQMAHFCSHGAEGMYISKRPGELAKVDNDWIRKVVYIFEGSVTCCRLGHQEGKRCDKELIVPTALAMYADLLWKVTNSELPHDSVEAIWEIMRCNLDRAFPQHFQYKTHSGQLLKRELFGPTIQWVHDQMSTDSNKLTPDELGSNRRFSKTFSSVTTVRRRKSLDRFATRALSQSLRDALQKAHCSSKTDDDDETMGPMATMVLSSPHQHQRLHTDTPGYGRASMRKSVLPTVGSLGVPCEFISI
eukprot:TRINITY_DN24094_c0_g1_i2.p1 TRINITY_DN24094_c0_g1~~TRINITY_DN24094_c0_g1_i2.p1  ORF type:complete len:343 (+),score=14.96 TRINITY_DN24094_c0_g1_i2:321-1349(+)